MNFKLYLLLYGWLGSVGQSPTLDACVGLGTTAMAGFVPAAELLQPNQIAAFKC